MGVGTGVALGNGAKVGVGIGVAVGNGVSVGVGTSVAVGNGVKVGVGTSVAVGNAVKVGVGTTKAAGNGVEVSVRARTTVGLNSGVLYGVAAANAVGDRFASEFKGGAGSACAQPRATMDNMLAKPRFASCLMTLCRFLLTAPNCPFSVAIVLSVFWAGISQIK